MLKITKVTGAFLAATLAGASTMANAQTFSDMTYYAGANLSWLSTTQQGNQSPTVDVDPVDFDADIIAAYGRFGMLFHPNFSGEVRLGFGLGEDEVELDGQVGDVDLKSYYGLYLRGGFPINDMFNPYAVLGYTWLDSELTWADETWDAGDSDSDISYGIGADFNVMDTVTINAEYILLVDADAEFGGFAIGLSKHF